MLDEKTQDFIRTHREEDVRRLALKPAPGERRPAHGLCNKSRVGRRQDANSLMGGTRRDTSIRPSPDGAMFFGTDGKVQTSPRKTLVGQRRHGSSPYPDGPDRRFRHRFQLSGSTVRPGCLYGTPTGIVPYRGT